MAVRMRSGTIHKVRDRIIQRILGVTLSGTLLIALLLASSTATAQSWVPQAPGPNTDAQVEGIAGGEVVGAINAVAVHPKDSNTIYVGAVNGGIWKTINGMAPISPGTAEDPRWEHQTDSQRSLSIGALEFDPTDATNQTLVAGTGCFSSYGTCGVGPAGLLRTTNSGASWIAVDGKGLLKGLNISGVAPRGAVIVISVNAADDPENAGIWRSTKGSPLPGERSGRL
jgi:hypothetical protein